MAYVIQDARVGSQPIADTSTVQNHPLGTVVNAYDPTHGWGRFQYLKGVANTVAGSWVTIQSDDWTTALLAAGAIGPVGIAMSANDDATDYGWYMIDGKCADAKASTASGTITDNLVVYIDDTAGDVAATTVAGDRVWGVRAASGNTTLGRVDVEIHNAFTNAGKNAST